MHEKHGYTDAAYFQKAIGQLALEGLYKRVE